MISNKMKLKHLSSPIWRTLSNIGNHIYPERNKDPIVISGSPRSGTTWIAETLAAIYKTKRVIWEPLQGGNRASHKLNLSKRPYIAHNASPNVYHFFNSLLTGQQMNGYLLRLQKNPKNIYSLLSNSQLIIKFIQGNGLLGYLHRTFNIPKPLVIIRHPCAVVSSQMKMWPSENHPYIDPALIHIYPEIKKVINNLRKVSTPERFAMTWAGDVLAAKNSLNQVNLVYYEDIVMNGAKALESTFQSWGWKTVPSELNEKLLNRSSTTYSWASLESSESKLSRWKKNLGNTSAQKILETVKKMGVKDYNESLFPDF